MAEQESAPQAVEQKSSGKGLIVGLIILIVVLILMFAGGGYYVVKSLPSSGGNQSMGGNAGANGNQTAMIPSHNGEFYNVELNDLVLNVTTSNGREKLMKLSFTLKSIEPDIMSLMEQSKPEVIDIVISLISARTTEELLTVGGKELLKEEMILEINKALNRSIGSDDYQANSIQNLFFTSFVIK